MTIQEIYNNEIQPLGEYYTYVIYFIDDENNEIKVNSNTISDLDEVSCLNILENIKNNPTFKCWALDSVCLSLL
jgi:hypothetical protein